MGLLDDAIRQHLELKRRHGADPSEVARQEQEALGPPRRGTAAEEVELAEHDELSGAVAAPEDVELHDDGDEDVPADDEEPYDDEDDDAPLEPSEPAGEPEAPVTPASAVDQPTQAYDVADLEADEPQDGEEGPRDASEDVLEETPEFLQETPEHDRLWFEQRPPRDFDF
jgi:hypothetical protein